MERRSEMSVTLRLLIGLCLVAVRPTLGADLPAAPGYALTDIGSLGGGQTFPLGLNARGDVVGYSTTSGGQVHAFVHPAGASMVDLGALGGAWSQSMGLNNRLDVVGAYRTASGASHAFLVLDGTAIPLGLEGAAVSSAIAINDQRQVLVLVDDGRGEMRSVLLQNGQLVSIPALGEAPAIGNGLNNLGQVVGQATVAGGTSRAFLYDSHARWLRDMGDIGTNGTLSHANEIGQAVGTRITDLGNRIAFGADLRNEGGFLADKLVRRGFSGTQALWINNEGTTVGAGVLSTGRGTNAGLWSADGQFLNLNQALVANSGWVLQTATSINDAGVIVGRALAPDGQAVAYMLTVPGPSLPSAQALAIAEGLELTLAVVRKGVAAAATAVVPSPLATVLVNLQQARSLLMPSTGQSEVAGVASGQAAHLLGSALRLLAMPDDSQLLSPAERESVSAAVTAAKQALG